MRMNPNFYDPGISAAQAQIRTYSNYSAAWCLWSQTDYTPCEAQSRLEAFSQLQPSTRYDPKSVRQHLLRGSLTLNLIQKISVEENPDLAMASALWLPVQAYYAVHGFGMAFLSTKHDVNNLPKTHGAFMWIAAEDIVRHLFPAPFSAMLEGSYKKYNNTQYKLINIRYDPTLIRRGFNIEPPNKTTRDAHIVQCLKKTRQKRQRKVQIAHHIAPTTVLDYLYRVRVKSNYEDPTMYHKGSDDAEAILELVRNTQNLPRCYALFSPIAYCGLSTKPPGINVKRTWIWIACWRLYLRK